LRSLRSVRNVVEPVHAKIMALGTGVGERAYAENIYKATWTRSRDWKNQSPASSVKKGGQNEGGGRIEGT